MFMFKVINLLCEIKFMTKQFDEYLVSAIKPFDKMYTMKLCRSNKHGRKRSFTEKYEDLHVILSRLSTTIYELRHARLGCALNKYCNVIISTI